VDVVADGRTGANGTGPAPRPARPPSLADALIPLVTLAVLIRFATYLFAPVPTNGPLQVALLLSAMVAALVVMKSSTRPRPPSPAW
jgi:hypothetical protein